MKCDTKDSSTLKIILGLILAMQAVLIWGRFFSCINSGEHKKLARLAVQTGGVWNCLRCGKRWGNCDKMHAMLMRRANVEGKDLDCENCKARFSPDVKEA